MGVLKTNIKRLYREFADREKRKKPTTKIQNDIEKLENALEILIVELEWLDEGLMSIEDANGKTGRIRIQKISNLIKKGTLATNRAYVQGVRRGNVDTKRLVRTVQMQLKGLIKEAKLPVEDKASLLALIPDNQTPEQLIKAMPDIQKRIDVAREDALVDKLTGKIETLLERSKLVKGSKRPQGKYDAGIQERLDIYKAIIKNPAVGEEAITKVFKDEMDRLTAEAKGEEYISTLTPEDLVKYDIASELSGFEDFNAAQLEVVALKLGELIETGKSIAAEKKTQRKIRMDGFVSEALASVTGGPSIPQGRVGPYASIVQKANQFLAADARWEGYNNLLSEYDVLNADVKLNHRLTRIVSTLDAENAEYRGTTAMITAFTEVLERILKSHGDNQGIVRKMVNDSGGKGFGLHELTFANQDGVVETHKYTKADLIAYYALFYSAEVNPRARNVLEGKGFTFLDQKSELQGDVSTEAAIESALTETEKDLARAGVQFMDTVMYPRINAWYKETQGVALPKEPRYFPFTLEGVSGGIDNVLAPGMYSRSLVPGSSISRKSHKYGAAPQNFYKAVISHIQEWEHAMAWYETNTVINAIYSNGKFKDAVTKRYGAGILKTGQYFINKFINSRANSTELNFGFLDTMRRNLIYAQLSFKGVTALKHLSTLPLYWWHRSNLMAPHEVLRHTARVISNPAAIAKILYESPVLQNRWRNVTQEAAALTNTGDFTALRQHPQLRDAPLAHLRFMDNSRLILGGGALYYHVLEKTGSPEAALRAVENITQQMQQGHSVSQVTHFRGMNQLTRTLTTFQSPENQHFQQAHELARDFWRRTEQKGPPSAREWGQFLAALAVLLLATEITILATSTIGLAYLPENVDPKVLWEKEKERQLRGFAVSAAGGLALLGDIWKGAVFAWGTLVNGDKKVDPEAYPWMKILDNFTTFGLAVLKATAVPTGGVSSAFSSHKPKADPQEKVRKSGASALNAFGIPGSNFYNAVTEAQKSYTNDDPYGTALSILGVSPSIINDRMSKKGPDVSSAWGTGKPKKEPPFTGLLDSIDTIWENYHQNDTMAGEGSDASGLPNDIPPVQGEQ